MTTKAEMEGRILTLTGEVASLKEQLATEGADALAVAEMLSAVEAGALEAETARDNAIAAFEDMAAQSAQAKETKTQMENMIESLRGQGALLKEKLAQAAREIVDLRNPKPDRRVAPKTCINCGQGQAPIQVTETGYKCPACEHEWTNAEEAAPFRQTG